MRFAQAIEDYAQQAHLFLKLGSLHYYRDWVAEAGIHWDQGHQLAQRIGHAETEAQCLSNLAVLKKNRADLASARGLYETVIDVQERLHDVEGLAKSWNNLGIIHDALGREEEALDAFERSRQYSEDTRDDLGIAIEEMNIASVQTHQERFEAAQERLERALEDFRSRGHAWYEVQALYHLGELKLAQGQLTKSKDRLHDALQLAQEIGSRKLAEYVQAALALAELNLGHGTDALEWAQIVEARLVETPPGIDDARVLFRLYRVFSEADMDDHAWRHLQKAYERVTHLASQLTDPQEREAFDRIPLYRAIIDAHRRLE